MVSKLSSTQKKILVKSYDKALSSGLNKEDAYDTALFSVGLSEQTKSNSVSQNIDIKTVVIKDGSFFNPQYYFDATLTSNRRDRAGNTVSTNLLKWISDNNRVDGEGDIKHLASRGQDSSYYGLFSLVKQKYEEGKLNIRFAINKTHQRFSEFMKENKKTPFNMLSAEFYSPSLLGDKIVACNGIGWTLTDDGNNTDANITGRVKQK